jgi:ribosomal protein S18 acetylase RimI-like enzyme
MLERQNSSDLVEWRLARPEDGPVWVALTREGLTPMVPSEALAEPDSRPNRDRQEMREELKRFLKEPPPIFGQRFLLWRASRPVGRLCFRVEKHQAHVGGLALLPSLEPDVTRQIAQIAIARARESRARSITAAYEARHAAAFAAAGFRETCRYTPMMAATRLAEEGEEEMAAPIVNTLYQMRPLDHPDSIALSELFRVVFAEESEGQRRLPTNWLIEMMLLGSGMDDAALPECSFVAEFRRPPPSLPRLLGATLVSRWQGAAMIDELLVQPRYRRLGVGTNLLRQSMLSLRQRGYASVMLVVMEGAPAQEFFRQMGFREVQTSYVEGEYIL